jgi:hypothetical protein
MAKDIIITPLDGDIVFDNSSGTECGSITQDGDNLVISNAVGDVLLGDGASDIYIGDGTNNVDILFEQSGAIKAEDGSTGVTLTIGSGDTTLALGSSISSDLTVGVNDTGHDVTFFGATSGKKMLWDQSADTLVVDGTLDINGDASILSGGGSGTLTVGRNANENMVIFVDDSNTTITGVQDDDTNAPHSFILNRTFLGSGANNFIIQKNGTAQLTLDTNGAATFVGDITASGNISASGTGSFGAVSLPDNGKLFLGTGDDLQIYHDGSNSYIHDNGTGHLNIKATNLQLLNAAGNKYYLTGADGNDVKIFHNGAEKFSTVSSGVNITGDLTATGTITAQEFHTEFVSASIMFESGSTKFGDTSDDIHQFSGSLRVTGSGDHYILGGNVGIGTTNPGVALEIGNISGGHIRLSDAYSLQWANANNRIYNQSNATIFVNNANESVRILGDGKVGIGTTTPTEKLTVTGNISASGAIDGASLDIKGLTNIVGATDIHGTLTLHNGQLLIEDSNSDNVHVNLNSNSTEGLLRLSNGSNFGLIARGIANSPRLGAYQNGYLDIYGFGTSTGADHANDDLLARFDFANEKLIVNGTLDVNGDADISGAITASGNISASGVITANSFVGALTGDATGLTGTPDIIVGSLTATSITSSIVTSSIIYTEGSNIFGDAISDTHLFNGHITASGNISASGAIDGASLDINGAADIAGNLVLSAGALSITGDGSNATTFTESGNGDFTIVSVDDIRLTAGGNDIVLRGASSAEFGRLSNSSQDFVIQNVTSNKDIIFAGNDGGSTIQALTLDISDAGSATFNNHITASGNISASGTGTHTFGGNVKIDNPSTVGQLYIDSAATSDVVINLSNNDVQKSKIGWDHSESALAFVVGTGAFSAAGMVLDSTGVGIGTTSPGTKLHVGAGSSATVDTGYQIVAESSGIAGIQILSATNQSGRVVFGDSGDNDIGMIKYDHTDNSMGFRTNGSGNERMRIDSAGKVGIGTDTPSAKLHVSGSDATDSSIRQSRAGVKIWDQAIDSSGRLQWGYRSSEGGSRTTTFTLDDNNNVGIGTGAPSAKLHVDGDAIITGTLTAQEFHTEFVSASIMFTSGSTKFGDTNDDIHQFTGSIQVSGSGDHYFANGNVGIGTSSPDTKLEIFEGYLKIGDSSNTGYGIALERNSATVGNINTANNRINIQSSNNRDVELRDTSGNNLILKHGGNVGIGTDIPTTKLTIQNTNSLVNFGNIQTTFSSSGTSGVPDVLIKDKDNSSTRAALQIQGNNGAQEVLFAASSGHVGIGTVSPGERLEVVGNISASGAIDGASLDINGNADISGNITTATWAGAIIPEAKLENQSGTNTGDNAANTTYGNVTNESKATMFTSPTFTGNITASGNISASGTINTNTIQPSAGSLIIKSSPITEIKGANDEYIARFIQNGSVDLYYNNNLRFETTGDGVYVVGNISASGAIDGASLDINGDADISGNITTATWAGAIIPEAKLENQSGTNTGDNAANTTYGNVTNESKATMFTSPTFTGNVTASGNISASGVIYADQFYANQTYRLKDSGGTSRHFIAGPASSTVSNNSIQIGNTNFSNGIEFISPITASGNISSSGTITGNSLVGTVGTATQGTIDIHSLSGYVANEHLDWTTDLGATNIHSGNYTDTTYSVGDGGLTTNDFTDEDHTKLNGIEASADVTDATNVTAAGALMDSELISIADVKALNQSLTTTATPTFGTLTTTNGTIFGEEGGTHQFTGNITASNNISASGTIIAPTINATNYFDSTSTYHLLTVDGTTLRIGQDSITSNISAVPLNVLGHITASGNISASGTITSLASTTTNLTVGSRIYTTIGAGTGNSVVLNSGGQLYTDEIDAGVWGAAGAVVTAEGEVVAPTATLASTSTLVATTDNAEFFVTLVDGASGAQALETSTKLKQNPSTGKLTVTGDVSASGTIVGSNLSGTNTGDQSTSDVLTLIEDGVDSVHYKDGSIDTIHIGDDQVTFAKALGVTPNVYGNYIKLLPNDFETSGDGGNTKFGTAFDKTAGATYGMRTSDSTQEVFAFVSIPEGMKATHVEIYGKREKDVEVFEVQINATTVVSKGTGICTIPGGSSQDLL